MGVLRVYLALCVIADHAGSVFPWQMHNGRQAVQIFYLISGFYMAMVLSSRYTHPRDFYLSRFLRIFPPYWIVVAGTFVVSLIAGLFFDRWLLLRTYISHPLNYNGAPGILLTALSNLTLIGQDWIMFLKQDFGEPLHFTANFWADHNPLWRYLLVPQAWTIGIELTFYACAPFLNRLRSRWLICIALGAFAARLMAYLHLGLDHDPWGYRFFPFEIGLFLFGMLGYRLYARTLPRHPSPRWRCVSNVSYLPGVGAILLFMYLDVCLVDYLGRFLGPEFSILVTYPLWVVALPLLFFAFGNHKFDRAVGEMSYPIYLVHYIVIVLVATCFGGGKGLGAYSALASVIVAALFYRLFIARLDRRRHGLTVEKRSKLREANAGLPGGT
jgi:peptidoglycan/LPS O-acetylase OafA/YrhL